MQCCQSMPALHGADLTPRLCDLCRVVELIKMSYYAPGAEALLAI